MRKIFIKAVFLLATMAISQIALAQVFQSDCSSDTPIQAPRIIDMNGGITEMQLANPTNPVIDISNFPSNI